MVQAATIAVRRTRPALCGTIAVVSVLCSPIVPGGLLFLGVLVVLVGCVVGALSRPGSRQDRAVVAVCSGLALLVGPASYLLLAVAT
ncbi:MAG: hypothetical protein AMXMBFR46_14030 [Acidimicrobiia bacterium]